MKYRRFFSFDSCIQESVQEFVFVGSSGAILDDDSSCLIFRFELFELFWYSVILILWETVQFRKTLLRFLQVSSGTFPCSFVNFLALIKGLTVISFNSPNSFCCVHFIFVLIKYLRKKLTTARKKYYLANKYLLVME